MQYEVEPVFYTHQKETKRLYLIFDRYKQSASEFLAKLPYKVLIPNYWHYYCEVIWFFRKLNITEWSYLIPRIASADEGQFYVDLFK